jgi:hypothetical protein
MLNLTEPVLVTTTAVRVSVLFTRLFPKSKAVALSEAVVSGGSIFNDVLRLPQPRGAAKEIRAPMTRWRGFTCLHPSDAATGGMRRRSKIPAELSKTRKRTCHPTCSLRSAICTVVGSKVLYDSTSAEYVIRVSRDYQITNSGRFMQGFAAFTLESRRERVAICLSRSPLPAAHRRSGSRSRMGCGG